MKKYLILLRHGKATERSVLSNDYDRPLITKGVEETKKIGAYLKREKINIDQIISSSSKRTKETAEIIADEINFQKTSIIYQNDLYEGYENGVAPYIAAIKKSIEKSTYVLICGHNPDITILSKELSGKEIPYMEKSSIIMLKLQYQEGSDLKDSLAKVLLYMSPEYL